ncbi:A disintegrin and metalloproteinase with thrombospondin motifs 9-like [Octopus bimaculoides]|uniref:A disintegrin and metalloproteinase with thrombospondin motifs 9-like n=1 Tax=Octopus bimaculoides TaxID=37653 RepID=UPI00071C4FCF|nr:A disintegrin and metalloproteinase with thrombospondin motifs 9-like [Octopus bimaculoides]|eukprot:XP_014770689.1 PREDICTED: A disintegrin and metalloproteinase with thrombospondin motifs 9-like [Octopus bimaculoides]
MNVFRKYNSFGQTWIRLYLILAFTSFTVYGEVYHSCEEAMISLGTSAVDGIYQIMTSSGHAVNLYCHGIKSKNPKEYLTLPAGRSKNYASVYNYVSLPYDCYQNTPRKLYSKRGRTEFVKVAFDIAANSIIRNDFTFTRSYGPNNISYGTAGGMFSPLPRCRPQGVFSIDLSGTPFIIHQKARWKWEGHFQDGGRNGTVTLSKYGKYKSKRLQELQDMFIY